MHLVNRLDCTWLYICDQMDAIVLIFFLYHYFLSIHLSIDLFLSMFVLFISSNLTLIIAICFIVYDVDFLFSFFPRFSLLRNFIFFFFFGINVTGVFTRLVVQNQHVIMCSHRNVSVFGYSLKIYGLKDSV